jgi:hypothetical protein
LEFVTASEMAALPAFLIFKQPHGSQTQLRDLAARRARGVKESLRQKETEGAGKAGCPLHP